MDNYSICAYCSKRRVAMEMTRVPRTIPERKKWVEILGEKFKEVCGFWLFPRICLSHFENLVNGRRRVHDLPKPLPYYNPSFKRKDEKEKSEPSTSEATCTKNEVSAIEKIKPKKVFYAHCSYCGFYGDVRLFSRTPTDDKRLIEWSHILGRDFLFNATRVTSSFICRTHFDLSLSGGKRLQFQLPIANWNGNVKQEENPLKMEIKQEEKPLMIEVKQEVEEE